MEVAAPGVVLAVLEEEVEAAVEEDELVLELAVDPPRPRSRRLPRSRGTIRAANFSAAMVPEIRTVFWISPKPTVAVRRVAPSALPGASGPAGRALR